ncbi:Uncharacterised protein [Mycobacteroides abscessus subsp. massiliense]|nr:Uncharacterised protein [Mycobacteroides abscessus subsp. massiliense]SKH84646.1 Uncharacterised protein [Mycobacteroides abscessus subsp. massiliense]SKK33314.1 Uncharacterised protein [Mycobacteroides abscessus subsp. massiliense]SKK46250.1 Uncharacterised protein [Mycobacteroides abscessus subsp. massiliense]SKL87716.1 Uncharacterised protein [Mycobacteroides abscessus subsp. massiliense]
MVNPIGMSAAGANQGEMHSTAAQTPMIVRKLSA